MSKKTTEKAAARKPTPIDDAPASVSELDAGTGSARVTTRNVVIYGPAKSRKTGACSNFPRGRTKWLVSDPNCIPTLRALKRLPHPNDIYPVNSLGQAVEFLEKVLALAVEKGKVALGIDTLIIDSDTQFSDWHQASVAADTNQRFMGDDEKNNGWQQFNAQFGRYLDLKALISEHIHVVSICHTKPGAKPGKTTFAGLNLPPQMAGKQERLANWVLFKSFTEVNETDISEVPNECLVTMGPDGKKRYFDSSLWVKPIEGWFASANFENPELAELDRVGGDLYALFQEEGLLE